MILLFSISETIEQYIKEEGLTDNESLQFLNLISDAKHLEYGTDGYEMDITEIEFTDPTFHIEANYMGVPGLGWGNVGEEWFDQDGEGKECSCDRLCRSSKGRKHQICP